MMEEGEEHGTPPALSGESEAGYPYDTSIDIVERKKDKLALLCLEIVSLLKKAFNKLRNADISRRVFVGDYRSKIAPIDAALMVHLEMVWRKLLQLSSHIYKSDDGEIFQYLNTANVEDINVWCEYLSKTFPIRHKDIFQEGDQLADILYGCDASNDFDLMGIKSDQLFLALISLETTYKYVIPILTLDDRKIIRDLGTYFRQVADFYGRIVSSYDYMVKEQIIITRPTTSMGEVGEVERAAINAEKYMPPQN